MSPSKLPFGGLSELQLLWQQLFQLETALKARIWTTARWELEHMLVALQKVEDHYDHAEQDPSEHPQEDEVVD